MSSRKSASDYAAAVKRLKARFPKLARLSRRRKNFTRGEKQEISYAIRAADIMTSRNAMERREEIAAGKLPAYFAVYKYPRDRKVPDNQIREEARNLARFATPATKKTLLKIARARKITPAMRATMTKKRRAIPFSSDIVPLSKQQAKNIPPIALRGKGKDGNKPGAGIYGIKLINHKVSSIKELKVDPKSGVLSFVEYKRTGAKKQTHFWYYIPLEFDVRTEGDFERVFNEAAQAAFENGANQVHVWTANGRTGEGFLSIRRFNANISGKYLEYIEEQLEESEDESRAGDWLIGLAVLYIK
jgi:hypothetical protein